MDKKQSDAVKKKTSSTNQKNESDDAADAVAKTGLVNRIYVNVGKKVGLVEWTKLEPRNIDKLISYHNIIYKIVDAVELQVQYVPKVLAKKEVICEPGHNQWELLGGWLNYLSQVQYQGPQSNILVRYSKACGKISIKETHIQKRTRSHLIKKMRMYTGDESEELNYKVDQLRTLISGIDEHRNKLKSAKTVDELRRRGEVYGRLIRGFNDCANDVQGMIDEVAMVVSIHQNELLKV
uniref:BAR domain-containing protein n=1 Tax=Caenorhabditis tropicalis TaxID=1561998 RepID=A0A1I7SXN6_9PELO